MYKIELSDSQSMKYFSCHYVDSNDHGWLILPKNIEILPDKVEYCGYGGVVYKTHYFKNVTDFDNFSKDFFICLEKNSLLLHEYIICYFEEEEEAFYFKLKYG